MGGLQPEISDAIRLLKPQSLKEAFGLARMRDDQLTKQQRFMRTIRTPVALPPPATQPPFILHKQLPSAGSHGRKCSANESKDYASIAMNSLRHVTIATNPGYCCLMARKTSMKCTLMLQWKCSHTSHKNPKSHSMPCPVG